MRIRDIVSLGKSYMLLGLIVSGIVAAVFLFGYVVVYQKALRGKKRLSKGNVIWGIVFFCYLMVVLGATLMDRGVFYMNGKIVPFFSSYREAWINFNVIAWRNLILNICMFVPFGFLLPFGIKCFRSFWKTYLAGLAAALLIETAQLTMGRGIFECDDILNNVLGTMIGYGIFEIVRWFVGKKRKSMRMTICCQIPLILTCTVFIGIYAVYEGKGVGNLKYGYVSGVDKKTLIVETKTTYGSEEQTVPVYRAHRAKRKETEQLAETFFQNMGDKLDRPQNDIYDETAIYKSEKGNTMWIDYNGMPYNFTDFETSFPDDDRGAEKDGNAEEGTIRQALKRYGVDIPEEAVFENAGDGVYYLKVSQQITDGKICDGILSCDYYKNGKFGYIENRLISGEYAKDCRIISEQEAYQKICDGKFGLEYYGEKSSLHIKLGGVQVKYRLDSKGFYQPVYIFEAEVNGTKTEVIVPALR